MSDLSVSPAASSSSSPPSSSKPPPAILEPETDDPIAAHQPANDQASSPSSSSSTSPSSSSTPSLLESRISDPPPPTPPPHPSLREPVPPDLLSYNSYPRPTLAQFRLLEGPRVRSAKLKALWNSLPDLPPSGSTSERDGELKLPGQDTLSPLSQARADRLRRLYAEELVRRVEADRPEAKLWGGEDDQGEPGAVEGEGSTSGSSAGAGAGAGSGNKKGKGIAWKDFRRFLWDQEKELWDIFQELDKDGDGRLDEMDLQSALTRSGIEMTPATLKDLVRLLASGHPSSPFTPDVSPNASLNFAAFDSDPGPQRSLETLPYSSTSPSSEDHKAAAGVYQNEGIFVTFAEFRDFLIMLPRKASMPEIYKFYQVRKRYPDGRGAARVNMEGELSVSFPKAMSSPNSPPSSSKSLPDVEGSETMQLHNHELDDDHDEHDHMDDEDEEGAVSFGVNVAWKFLLAGGIAGAVSRTATAPFDRLKVYLITAVDEEAHSKPRLDSSQPRAPIIKQTYKLGEKGFAHLWNAIRLIYKDGGGVRAFWVGNGLNVTKIFPESAIKFFSYEYSKRFFARYWDKVPEQADISGTSRFIAGGIGGITSQLSIYPIETLKTQLQSSVGPVKGKDALLQTARNMWKIGGMRAYYRGLTLGLIGVFPYSAIDMSTFEALKIAYCKYNQIDEPQTWAVLSFGAISGSIGATSVYPINLLRTRLQASGSSGHPTIYTGFWDVTQQTLAREGWMGLYKGLVPTLAKVIPAVSISYVVYEHSKRALHIS